MPRSLFPALLAVAAVGALTLAVVRSVDASNRTTEPAIADRPLQIGATAAQMSATLARLHPPPGFRRGTCRPGFALAGSPSVCFYAAQSLALDEAGFDHVVAGMGARHPRVVSLPFDCGRRRELFKGTPPGWRRGNCIALAAVGREQIEVVADSLRVGRAAHSARARRAVAAYLHYPGPGTHVEVSVLGHRLPPGVSERDLLKGCDRQSC